VGKLLKDLDYIDLATAVGLINKAQVKSYLLLMELFVGGMRRLLRQSPSPGTTPTS
jgi:hypothetical protein